MKYIFSNKTRIIWGLIFLKLIISLIFITAFSIDLDEPFSIFHAQKNLDELFPLFVNENNPPLHFLLLHFWIKLFGISPVAVRSLSLLFALITIPLLIKIGEKLSNFRTGVLLALFFIFSSFHHYYGIEARTYSLLVFEFALLLVCILSFQNSKGYKVSIFIGIVHVLLFYTHYIAPVVIVSSFATMWLLVLLQNEREKKRILLKHLFLGAFPTTLLLILPWINVFLTRLTHVSEKGTWINEAQWSELYGNINKFFNGKYVVAFILLWVIFLIIREINTMKKIPLKRLFTHRLSIILFPTILIYFTVFVLSKTLGVHLFLDRYLFFLSIPLFAILAYFTDYYISKYKWIAFTPLLVFLFFFNPSEGNNRESDKLADFVKDYKESTIIISPPTYDIAFLYYHDIDLFKKQLDGKALFEENIFPVYSFSQVENHSINFPLIYINADSKFSLGNEMLKDELDTKFSIKTQLKFKGNYTVTIYDQK